MRLALEHRRVGLAEHLDVSERKRVILVAKIEIIEPERLLKARRVGCARDCDQRRIVVAHVVAADHTGAVREPVGMRQIGRAQQESGGVDRTTSDETMSPRYRSVSRPRCTTTSVASRPLALVSMRSTWAPVSRLTLV